MERERCKQLRLPLMVSDTDQHHATNFTISIEAAEGITTGISAHDRAKTIQAAVAKDAKPEHLSQPGHIFRRKDLTDVFIKKNVGFSRKFIVTGPQN